MLVGRRQLGVISPLRRDPWGQLYPFFLIWSPNYAETSSGSRVLFLLCHLLNHLGYEAYVTGRGAPAPLFAPQLAIDELDRKRASGREDIAVYPEVVVGNPLGARKVVRYLLNRPGYLAGAGMAGYGKRDFFAHFAEEFRPDGLISQPLALPTVDTNLFRSGSEAGTRSGYILYEHRSQADVQSLPDWLHPWSLASFSNLRSAAEMAQLYRRSQALVVWERTAAILEALHCGCPVIIAPGVNFDYAPFVRRFGREGIAIGWDREELQRASDTVAQFPASYAVLYEHMDDTVRAFAEAAIGHFRNARRGRRAR